MKQIALALCAVALVGCGKEIKVVCTGNEEIEVGGKLKETISTQVSVRMTSSGKAKGGGMDAYSAEIGTDSLFEGFGNNQAITAWNTTLPGIRMKYNLTTDSIKIERWNRNLGDAASAYTPLIIKTFTGVCK